VKRLIIVVGCDATLQTRQFNRKGLYTIDGRRLERLNPRYTYGPENRDAFFLTHPNANYMRVLVTNSSKMGWHRDWFWVLKSA